MPPVLPTLQWRIRRGRVEKRTGIPGKMFQNSSVLRTAAAKYLKTWDPPGEKQVTEENVQQQRMSEARGRSQA